MKRTGLLAMVLAACASTPRSEFGDHAVLSGYTVEEVREAARIVVDEIAHPPSVVRVSDYRVLTEGRIGVCARDVDCGGGTEYIQHNTGTPWATIEVRFEDLGRDTAVEVEIEYLSSSHCMGRNPDVTCLPDQLGSTGHLERRIIDRIRARLETDAPTMDLFPRAKPSVLARTEVSYAQTRLQDQAVESSESCDPLWDGPIFGLLPGVLAGLIWSAAKADGTDVSTALIVGAVGGAIAGLIIDGAICGSSDTTDGTSVDSSAIPRIRHQVDRFALTPPANLEGPSNWTELPSPCHFLCGTPTQAPLPQDLPSPDFASPESGGRGYESFGDP